MVQGDVQKHPTEFMLKFSIALFLHARNPPVKCDGGGSRAASKSK